MVCKAFYRAKKQEKPHPSYFIEFKRTYEELIMLLPFTSGCEDLTTTTTTGADGYYEYPRRSSLEFEITKAQVLISFHYKRYLVECFRQRILHLFRLVVPL